MEGCAPIASGYMALPVATEEQPVTFTIGCNKIRCPLAPLLKNEYLLALLTGSMREAGAREVEIEGVSYETFQRIINYLESEGAPVSLPTAQWVELCYASHQFQVHALVDICAQSLTVQAGRFCQAPHEPSSKRFDEEETDDFLSIFQVADILDLTELKQMIKEQVLKNRGWRGDQGCKNQLMASRSLGKAYIRLLPCLIQDGLGFVDACFSRGSVTRTSYRGFPTVTPDAQPSLVDKAIADGSSEVVKLLLEDNTTSSRFDLRSLIQAARAKRIDTALLILPLVRKHPSSYIQHQGQSIGELYIPQGQNPLLQPLTLLLGAAYQTHRKAAFGQLLTLSELQFSAAESPEILLSLVRDGVIDWLELLWPHITEAEVVDAEKNGCVHIAAQSGNVGLVEWLISRKVPVGTANAKGQTPLHIALARDTVDPALVKVLATRGLPSQLTQEYVQPDPLLTQDQQGKKPIDLALDREELELSVFLFQQLGEIHISDVLHRLIQAHSKQRCKELVEHIVKVDDQELKDRVLKALVERTPGQAFFDLPLYLIKNGANVNVRTKDDATALHVAASNGLSDACSLLLELKAQLEARDAEGRSPLHLAALNGHPRTVDTLLKAGAEIEPWDAKQRTPYQLAYQNKDAPFPYTPNRTPTHEQQLMQQLKNQRRADDYKEVLRLLESKSCVIQ